ncbi:uncharacterized protein LOC111411587 isoform X2 [Olea europaea var. sylvestris]|uniref:uncharacterized protein LOC111411587 isoform X2 n=1 Tax=Olea europaea var. sylvestris TaxID=158386 RepID=UPI000C1D4328|nr:uncharacterized protein LOC111411587 isoform X2 [Olea europaea var. sylvestris]
MVVLLFAMVCGVYICSICMRQINARSNGRVLSVKVVERLCEVPEIQPSEKPYLHFPQPKTFARAECGCNPVQYFVILSTQRSGSGWFETMLNSHINITSNGEIFSNKVRRSNASSIVETLDKIYNLDWLTSASKNECTAAVGLKWMLNQGLTQHHVEIVEYFKSKGVSAIFLFRRNLLRRMISILANSYDQNAKPLNGTHKSHVHSPQEKLLDVQDFLRVPRMDLNSRQVKIHKGSLSLQVQNWDEVEKTLKGTQYESFLYEDYKMS